MRFGDFEYDPEYANFKIRFDTTSTYLVRIILAVGLSLLALHMAGVYDRLPVPLIDTLGEILIYPFALTIGPPVVVDMPTDVLSTGFQRSRHFVGLLGCLSFALLFVAAVRAPYCTASSDQRLPYEWRRRRHWETVRPFKLAFGALMTVGFLSVAAFLAAATKNGFSGFVENESHAVAVEIVVGIAATFFISVVAYATAHEILLAGALRRYLVDD